MFLRVVNSFWYLAFLRTLTSVTICNIGLIRLHLVLRSLSGMKYSLLALWAAQAAALAKPKPQRPLSFKKDGTFQIAIFEDLHYGEGQ